MLTLDTIQALTKEEFSKLSKENQQLILQILAEYRDTGESKTLKDLYWTDYEEIPVPVEEFICNPTYLGKSTRNGESIYPYWKKKYKEIFDPSLGYEEIVLTGAIGVGKTRTAVISLCYLLYKLMCLKNPHEYFRFNEGDKITVFFLNITLALAEGVGFKTMHEYLLNSHWFLERGTITGRKELRYKPPHHIDIAFGSKGEHALGQQIYCGFLDECDFKRVSKGQSALDAQSSILEAYRTIKTRIVSRFTKNDVLYGRLFMVSSKRTDDDFLESYVRKMKNDKMLVVDEPQWVIKPKGTFSEKTFPVAVGNRSLKSRMMTPDTPKEELEALKKQGYTILDVPMNFEQNFKLDISTALMDLAGISIAGAVSFFNYDMFSPCYNEEYKNPFVSDILTIGIRDDLQIKDFFIAENVPVSVRRLPQYIHVDASLTGDKTGISSVGASGLKPVQNYNGADESITQEMTYKHIFSVDIMAPQGSEISFEKTRNFIYYLRSIGFNIQGVSLDGFQSADSRQILESQGYSATIISLDKSPQGYLTLRSAMNDLRISLIKIPKLEDELIHLQRDVQTGKIDHPVDGCFVKETKIQLADGDIKTIEELLSIYDKKDIYVYTVNENTHNIEKKRIRKVFKTKKVEELVEITINNKYKEYCTKEHKFMVESGQFLQAQDIYMGTKLKSLYKNSTVTNVSIIKKKCEVFDLEIEDNHNFSLACGVFVHNSKDMSDSLAGALFNATIHKQDLIDSMQLFDVSVDINSDTDRNAEMLKELSESLMSNRGSRGSNQNTSINPTTSNLASQKLDDLLNSFGSSDIIAW